MPSPVSQLRLLPKNYSSQIFRLVFRRLQTGGKMGMSVTMFFRLSTLNTSQINLIFLVHCSLLGLPSALLPEAKQRDSFGQLTPPHQVLTPVSYPYQSSYHENDHFKGLGMFQRYASTHSILTAIATKEDPIFSFMNKPTCKSVPWLAELDS